MIESRLFCISCHLKCFMVSQEACVGQANITQHLWETHNVLKASWKTPGHLWWYSELCATELSLKHFSLQLKPPAPAVQHVECFPFTVNEERHFQRMSHLIPFLPVDHKSRARLRLKYPTYRDKLGQVNPSVPSSNTEDSLEWIDAKHPTSNLPARCFKLLSHPKLYNASDLVSWKKKKMYLMRCYSWQTTAAFIFMKNEMSGGSTRKEIGKVQLTWEEQLSAENSPRESGHENTQSQHAGGAQ